MQEPLLPSPHVTPLDRRSFLKGAAAVTAGTALTGPAFSRALAVEPAAVFQYGVASGDPLPDGVVLWTRVTPSPDATPGSGKGAPVTVTWSVRDAQGRVVRRGSVRTDATRDHTVKVDVRGLASDRGYTYAFSAAGASSPVGRTRTAAADGAANATLRFGMVSCSNYTGGYFSAYRHLAERDDLDFVLHLGDYLYEYGNGEDRYGPAALAGKRDHDPATEMVTLSDYRRRHALYKSDPDLAALHRKYAFITTWDDHEVANDTWREGAENHQEDAEGAYVPRRNRSYQAYDEWMPIRLPEARSAQETRIYRRLRFGSLADLTMLDLRQYRDQQAPATDGATIDAPDRTMTGPEQQAFLEQGLAAAGSPTWRLFGNSVQLMQVKAPPLPAATAAALAALQGGPQPVSLPASGFALIVDRGTATRRTASACSRRRSPPRGTRSSSPATSTRRGPPTSRWTPAPTPACRRRCPRAPASSSSARRSRPTTWTRSPGARPAPRASRWRRRSRVPTGTSRSWSSTRTASRSWT